MAEIFPIYYISLNELINAYLIEASGLSKIISTPQSSELLRQHNDYEAFLITNSRKNKQSKDFNSYLTGKNGIIYSNDPHPLFKHALYSAHISSCCELFNGHRYTKLQLESTNFSYIIKNWLQQYDGNKVMIARLSSALHMMDAVRTIQILRVLSLVTIRTHNILQLSIGAGPADKDITAIHSLPKITLSPSKTPEESELLFEMLSVSTKNIVISDIDPQRKEQYSKLTNEDNSNIIALNIDTYDALAESSSLIKHDKIQPRNLFVALRIDHRMLPDIKLFFKLLWQCMDQSADLIITMGSGHTIEDFEGRIHKINEIFDFLFKLKLKPTLLKLHGKGTLEQQQNSNSFSTRSITTYQILYCKLKKKILQKAVKN
jgi:hypothetical protein